MRALACRQPTELRRIPLNKAAFPLLILPLVGCGSETPTSPFQAATSIAIGTDSLSFCLSCERPAVFVVDVDRPEPTNLTERYFAYAGLADPSWSPDGGEIVFGRDGDLWLLAAHGSSLEKLTDTAGGEVSPAWSPDGNRIAFIREGSVHVMDRDGSNVRRLIGPLDPEGSFLDVSWSR